MGVISKRPSLKHQQSGAPSSSSSTYLLLAVKVLLVLVILFLLPKLVIAGNPSRGKKKKHEFEVRTLRSHCASQTCAAFIPEEGMNCLLACVSPSCFARVYGLTPLEEGEVDVDRANAFETCLKEELRVLRSRKKNRFIQ